MRAREIQQQTRLFASSPLGGRFPRVHNGNKLSLPRESRLYIS